MGRVDASGNYIEDGGDAGTGNSEGGVAAGAFGGGASSGYDDAMSGLMMQSHLDCINTISNSMGEFGYFYGYQPCQTLHPWPIIPLPRETMPGATAE